MFANVEATIELIMELPENRELTAIDYEEALIKAIERRYWFIVKNVKLLEHRPELG